MQWFYVRFTHEHTWQMKTCKCTKCPLTVQSEIICSFSHSSSIKRLILQLLQSVFTHTHMHAFIILTISHTGQRAEHLEAFLDSKTLMCWRSPAWENWSYLLWQNWGTWVIVLINHFTGGRRSIITLNKQWYRREFNIRNDGLFRFFSSQNACGEMK